MLVSLKNLSSFQYCLTFSFAFTSGKISIKLVHQWSILLNNLVDCLIYPLFGVKKFFHSG